MAGPTALVAVSLLAAGCARNAGPTGATSTARSATFSMETPDFRLKTLRGQEFHLASALTHNKALLVNFWQLQ